jgi:hypothetical protein
LIEQDRGYRLAVRRCRSWLAAGTTAPQVLTQDRQRAELTVTRLSEIALHEKTFVMLVDLAAYTEPPPEAHRASAGAAYGGGQLAEVRPPQHFSI